MFGPGFRSRIGNEKGEGKNERQLERKTLGIYIYMYACNRIYSPGLCVFKIIFTQSETSSEPWRKWGINGRCAWDEEHW